VLWFARQLKALHMDVTSLKSTSLETVHLIQHIFREVNLLQLWLSPLAAVTHRLASDLPDENESELRRHLEDLQDHVQALKEQTSSMVRAVLFGVRGREWGADGWVLRARQSDWAKSLNDEYLNEQQYRCVSWKLCLTLSSRLMCSWAGLLGAG
jgi:hypothetical protein